MEESGKMDTRMFMVVIMGFLWNSSYLFHLCTVNMSN